MLTGRAARTTTWRIIDEWLTENSTPEAEPAGAGRASSRKPARKSPAKKAPSKKAPAAKKTPAKKAAAAKPRPATAPSADAIGANPDRRYASASSRGLAAKK
jgi:polyhydroxyalkanoate synthase